MYKLDFEDIVGGIPTRFKFRQVPPNDFGLTAEELLYSEERELNRWAPLRKVVTYREEDEESKDIRKYHSHNYLNVRYLERAHCYLLTLCTEKTPCFDAA